MTILDKFIKAFDPRNKLTYCTAWGFFIVNMFYLAWGLTPYYTGWRPGIALNAIACVVLYKTLREMYAIRKKD